jgi:hypothetical protein
MPNATRPKGWPEAAGWFLPYFPLLKERLALGGTLLYSGPWTGGRVVDGTALEMRRTCKGTVGSNPTLSAK